MRFFSNSSQQTLSLTVLEFSWVNNCIEKTTTNGVDLKLTGAVETLPDRRALSHSNAVGLPGPFVPTAYQVNGSNGVIISFSLPNQKIGVVCPVYSHGKPLLIDGSRCL